MEESKRTGWKFYLAETAVIITGTLGMFLLGYLRKQPGDKLLGNCIMTLFMLAVSGLQFRREYIFDRLDYDNGEHLSRVFMLAEIGVFFAFVCGFLPVAGWPFLFLYVMLSLFSNANIGTITASSLLLISVLISGAEINAFVLYFVCGVFGVTMFRNFNEDFHVGIALFLSIMVLLVCETANLILPTNAHPDLEMFVIPVVNMVLSGLLLLILLKYFFANVVYSERDKYLDINDTENEALVRLREKDKKEYMRSIHTAYFCERIGNRLHMDVDALKGAAYYHRIGEGLGKLMEEKQFPPVVRQILTEYMGCKKQGIKKRETAVLLFSDTVVSTILLMMEKEDKNTIDFDKIIDTIYRKLSESPVLDSCDITVRELRVMQKIFKEEKLYYDFLR